jgi:ubinuclein
MKAGKKYKMFAFQWLQQASQGKLSKELLNRLMSILGHLIQLRTLKVSSCRN